MTIIGSVCWCRRLRHPFHPALVVLMACLAGCNPSGSDKRYGIAPVLDATQLQAATANKTAVMKALEADAGFPDSPPDYYLVAEAGFNYVDDQCRGYFDDLFFLDRRRDRIKSGLIAAGQTAAAILSVTGASAMSLAVAAQAFGFSASATDLIAGTYLYSLPPSTTQGFVQRLQLAFRDAAAAKRTSINSPGRAYYMIQRYLDLCLPPRIETEIGRQIATARAYRVDHGEGAFFSLETVSAEPPVILTPPPTGTKASLRKPTETAKTAPPSIPRPAPTQSGPAAASGPASSVPKSIGPGPPDPSVEPKPTRCPGVAVSGIGAPVPDCHD